MEQKKQIAYLQWLRIFAAAAVVMIHTSAIKWWTVSYETPEWTAMTMYDSLVRWPVPVFIMITGALLVPRKTSMKTVLGRYIPLTTLVYLFWSGVHALHGWHNGAEPKDVLYAWISGHYHLWYLPFLAGVYLTLPFLQRIAEDEKLSRQLLAAGCVIGLLVPWLTDLGALLRPGGESYLRVIESKLNVSFFFDHISIVLLGHFLHKTDFQPLHRRILYALGLLGVALTGVGTIWATRHAGAPNSLFFDYAAPHNLCTAAAIFVFAKYHLTALPKAADWIAARSFGIYLTHVLVLELLEEQGIHPLAWDPVWSVPVLSAAVFTLSLLLTAVLEKIPVLGKYLV